MTRIYASIITIGDELLIGQVIDTNSSWIGKVLNEIGIWVKHRVAVGDNWDDIWDVLQEEEKIADIIIITGGLGPTADDITKPLLNKYFEGSLIIDELALQNVQQIFAHYNRPLLKSNYKQAEVPDVCTVIQNKRGTAPGMQFEKNNKLYFSLPGVPYEMKGMMKTYILPLLKEKYNLPPILHKTIITCGLGESLLAERLKEFESEIPKNIKLAYLPGVNIVRLRLTEIFSADAPSLIEQLFIRLQDLVSDITVNNQDFSIVETIAQELINKNKTLATAESCTGGYIASQFTSLAGASKYFKGSIVSYDNTIKQNVLNVQANTLVKYGAVSKETVIEMVNNIIQLMQVDYSIAISGILGPDGGTAEKPVGTVWIAVASKTEVKAQKFQFKYNREKNKEAATNNALYLLYKLLKNK